MIVAAMDQEVSQQSAGTRQRPGTALSVTSGSRVFLRD
jgi:hypothetical protein